MISDLKNIFVKWNDTKSFSGVFSVRNKSGVLYEEAFGFRNRPEKLKNTVETKFAIASGTKFFTALGVLILIDKELLKIDDFLSDLLGDIFPYYDRKIQVLHLLNHTSGITDYFDEEKGGGIEEFISLWNDYPTYSMLSLSDYLPLFQNRKMKYEVNSCYSYNNAGFITLGLIIEKVTGRSYEEFITDEIINKLGLMQTGFYKMDMLPENTAIGYIEATVNGQWKSNIFSTPVIGAADGGSYTNVKDMNSLWRHFVSHNIISKKWANEMINQRVWAKTEDEYTFCGLGMYIYEKNNNEAYFIVGGDSGADFFSAYYPKQDLVITTIGNTEKNTWPLMIDIHNMLLK